MKKVNVKLVGIALVLCAIGLWCRNTVKVNALEKEESEAIILSEIIAKKESTKALENTNVDKSFDENIEHFFWNNKKNVGMSSVGFIKCDKYNIDTPLSFGGENEKVLLGSCGIHRDLSDTRHLTVLGHNCERYSKLKDKLFTNIKYLNVGDKVEMDTPFGLYNLVVEKTVYVSPSEYRDNNYSVVLEGDVSFVTCEWHGKEKGRRIVYLRVDSLE